jgi:UDPglucose 6-dehydrogenase
MAIVSVIGAGYVGLTTGACLAQLGHRVILVDTDTARVAALSRGEVPIYEPGLTELIQRHHASGNICFTNEMGWALPGSQFAFITVNTPPRPDGHADTSFVYGAAASITEHAPSNLVLVVKSTVPVGTGDQIARMVAQSPGSGVEVVSNPEFLREGSAIKDFLQPDRIVIGADSDDAAIAVAGLYSSIDARKVLCSRRSAELAKYASNALLATRISFMNEISIICEASQADIDEVMDIVGADQRIGPHYLKAGLGWGGSCFPKDVQSLVATASRHGCSSSILDAVIKVNSLQRQRAVDMLLALVADAPDPVIGVLGLAFKPNTDDLRESPAMDIIARLSREGVNVRAHDPIAVPKACLALPEVAYCQDPYSVAEGADALLLATEWDNYLSLDWRKIAPLMRHPIVLDGRNSLDGPLLSKIGFTYLSFGRSAADECPSWRRAHAASGTYALNQVS